MKYGWLILCLSLAVSTPALAVNVDLDAGDGLQWGQLPKKVRQVVVQCGTETGKYTIQRPIAPTQIQVDFDEVLPQAGDYFCRMLFVSKNGQQHATQEIPVTATGTPFAAPQVQIKRGNPTP